MSSGARKKLFAGLAVAWTIGIALLAGSPTADVPGPIPHFDKILHFGAFALLSLLIAFSTPRRKFLWIVVLPGFYGLAIEVFQALTNYRKGEFSDLSADLIGCLLVYICYILYRKHGKNSSPGHRD